MKTHMPYNLSIHVWSLLFLQFGHCHALRLYLHCVLCCVAFSVFLCVLMLFLFRHVCAFCVMCTLNHHKQRQLARGALGPSWNLRGTFVDLRGRPPAKRFPSLSECVFVSCVSFFGLRHVVVVFHVLECCFVFACC